MCHFLPYITLFLGVIQKVWVWETDLGPNPILLLTGYDIPDRLSDFVEFIFSSEKQISTSY